MQGIVFLFKPLPQVGDVGAFDLVSDRDLDVAILHAQVVPVRHVRARHELRDGPHDLRREGGAKVLRLLTLGTPHAGSELAKIGFGENGRQMRPSSAWLESLNSEAPQVETLVIFSPHDNYVMPQSNLELPGAQSQRINALGHLSMLYSPRVAAAVLDGLGSFRPS